MEEIKLIDLVTVYLQETMNIPHWPNDSRFYALGNDRSFVAHYGQIKVYDKKNEKVFTLSFDSDMVKMHMTGTFNGHRDWEYESKHVSAVDPEFFPKIEEFILFGI